MIKFICWPCAFCEQGFDSLGNVFKHEERYHADKIEKSSSVVKLVE